MVGGNANYPFLLLPQPYISPKVSSIKQNYSPHAKDVT